MQGELFYIKDRNQTTTNAHRVLQAPPLFYIKDRNQTTTTILTSIQNAPLFYIKDRNQTTTALGCVSLSQNYFTSKIEIKPQPAGSMF